jgi:UDP-2,3-diacylglucosamine hydrolase
MIYFASDQHFGAPDLVESKKRELLFIKWLDSIKKEATELFLLGDLFDFWFEYKTVVPKGFIQVLSKLIELRNQGVKIHFFVGNHDLWMRDYFEKELGIKVYHKPTKFIFNDKTFLIGHGDGLGPGDTGYKLMKKVFINPIAKWMFRWLHPDIGMRLAQYLSIKNKYISGEEDLQYLGDEKENLVQFCREEYKKTAYNYFIFGHRHLALEIEIAKNSTYINTGDWVSLFSYTVFDGDKINLKYFS